MQAHRLRGFWEKEQVHTVRGFWQGIEKGGARSYVSDNRIQAHRLSSFWEKEQAHTVSGFWQGIEKGGARSCVPDNRMQARRLPTAAHIVRLLPFPSRAHPHRAHDAGSMLLQTLGSITLALARAEKRIKKRKRKKS